MGEDEKKMLEELFELLKQLELVDKAYVLGYAQALVDKKKAGE